MTTLFAQPATSSMKTPKKVISGALNTADIFEDPIHFNMGGETAMTSILGGILSLAIIIFLGVQAISQTIEMFSRQGPQLIQMNEFEGEPAKIYLNTTNNFVFAVAMTRDNANIDLTTNAIMSFTSSYSHYIRAADGSQTKIKAAIYWAPCTKANFSENVFPKDTFNTYSLQYAYCPTKVDFTDTATNKCPDSIKVKFPSCQAPAELGIRGTFLSLDFEFIQFKLKKCSAADAKYIAGLQCTTENIDTVFANSEMTLNLYYSNNLIDPVNFQTPNKTFLDTIYWNVNPSVAAVADIFMDIETVQDFQDFFSADNHINRTFYSINTNNVRELRKYRGTSLLEWNLRRSSLNHITTRRYTKVLDVVSNIGGMSELFILLGAFIAIGYARYKYQMILSNVLYDFEPTEQDKPPKISSVSTDKSGMIALATTTRVGDDSADTLEMSRIRSVFKIATKKKTQAQANQTIKDYFELQKKRKRILPYSEVNYFKHIAKFLFCIKKNPEEIMAIKARKLVVRDLDIIKVVEKLKEIDKLKMLLLNPDQRKAFDFIEKPLIALDQESPIQAGSFETFTDRDGVKSQRLITNAPEYESLSDYAKVYMAYRALQDDMEASNNRYNQKLIDMMGEDIRIVFKRIDQIMGSNVDPKLFEDIVNRIVDQQQDETMLLNDKSPSYIEDKSDSKETKEFKEPC